MYFLSNVVFSVLIHVLCNDGENPNVVLVVLRVATLDGLFLIMGITLAVCILIVSVIIMQYVNVYICMRNLLFIYKHALAKIQKTDCQMFRPL